MRPIETYYVIYYPNREEIVALDSDPDQRDFPEADFADGPFHTERDAEIRAAMMRNYA